MATAEKTYDSVVDHRKIGAGVKSLREGLNLEPAKVKERVGLTPQRISKIEAGSEMTVTELGQLAAAFDYTPGGLLTKVLRDPK